MADLLHRDSRAEVWLGSCLDAESVERVMGGRKADLICLDAPYSEKTHGGHDSATRRDASTMPDPGKRPSAIKFPLWKPENVARFVELWVPRCAGWLVSITDHVLAPHWCAELERHDRYVFAPLPLVETGGRIRLTGDGPSSWTCWVVVARPKNSEFSRWGTLPGAYLQPADRCLDKNGETTRVVGGKPLSAMLRIVGDYSRRGGLVVDPTCGGGTTLKAAIASGRQAIGMDVMREHAELTIRNIASTREQTSLFEVGT